MFNWSGLVLFVLRCWQQRMVSTVSSQNHCPHPNKRELSCVDQGTITVTCLYSLHVYNTLMWGLLALLPLLKIKREDIREYKERKVLFQKITKILVKMLRYWSRKIYCMTKKTRHKWVITSHCSCLHTGFFDELKPDLVWELRTKNSRDWHKEIWV